MFNILFVAVVFFFSVTIFVVFLHFYAKCVWFSNSSTTTTAAAAGTTNVIYARRSFVFRTNNGGEPRKGLDPEAIKSLKTLVYKSEDRGEPIECAVCLSEVTDGETIRLLPNCNHGFHVECIDMWLFSHSTCPLCRNAVVVDEKPVVGYSTESPSNNLFWGNNQNQVGGGEEVAAESTLVLSREGVLVLDIPRRVLTEDDLKSPATGTPMSARLGSLKRFLSREKKVSTSPSSSSSVPPSSGDVEEGIRHADDV